MLPHAPGVQMSNIPEDSLNADDKAEADKENPDERISSKFYLYLTNIEMMWELCHRIAVFAKYQAKSLLLTRIYLTISPTGYLGVQAVSAHMSWKACDL